MNPSLLDGPAIRKFRSSAVLRDSLKNELLLPGISAALEAMEASLRITHTPESVPGLHPDSVVSREYFRIQGSQRTITTLRAMVASLGTHDLEKTPAGLEPFADPSNIDPRFADPLPPDQRVA
jgi:hypothetical protein